MSQFPEHDKVRVVQPQSQSIHEFIDWLANEKKIHLAEWEPNYRNGTHSSRSSSLIYARKPITELVAEFFEVDLKKFNAEKEQMYEALTSKSNG